MELVSTQAQHSRAIKRGACRNPALISASLVALSGPASHAFHDFRVLDQSRNFGAHFRE